MRDFKSRLGYLQITEKVICIMMEKLDRIAELNTEMQAILTLLTDGESYIRLNKKHLDSMLHSLLNNTETINRELLD